MKSIKPGRGPSMMSGISCILVALFGIGWTVIAAATAPFMAFFGLIFVAMAVVMAVYNFKNAKSKNRYSAFDIVDSREESDPLNERYGAQSRKPDANFCPYCGIPVTGEYKFCPDCGRKLPENK